MNAGCATTIGPPFGRGGVLSNGVPRTRRAKVYAPSLGRQLHARRCLATVPQEGWRTQGGRGWTTSWVMARWREGATIWDAIRGTGLQARSSRSSSKASVSCSSRLHGAHRAPHPPLYRIDRLRVTERVTYCVFGGSSRLGAVPYQSAIFTPTRWRAVA